MFFYQDAETPVSGESHSVCLTLCEASESYLFLPTIAAEMARSGLVPSSSKATMKRVIATDGLGDPLKGTCVFFLRPNNSKPVTSANVAEVGGY